MKEQSLVDQRIVYEVVLKKGRIENRLSHVRHAIARACLHTCPKCLKCDLCCRSKTDMNLSR